MAIVWKPIAPTIHLRVSDFAASILISRRATSPLRPPNSPLILANSPRSADKSAFVAKLAKSSFVARLARSPRVANCPEIASENAWDIPSACVGLKLALSRRLCANFNVSKATAHMASALGARTIYAGSGRNARTRLECSNLSAHRRRQHGAHAAAQLHVATAVDCGAHKVLRLRDRVRQRST